MVDSGALVARIERLKPKSRGLLIAIAGAPGTGKSTLAEVMVLALGARAALVPMDGFHLDNRLLKARGLLARKGAPETFDAAGFAAMIRRLTSEDNVVIPVFDRDRDIAIAGASAIGPETEIAVVEGNYLLLDAPIWRDLRPLWDLTVFLDVPADELECRLRQRWLDYGLGEDVAHRKVAGNDLPNAKLVREQSAAADLIA